jgi:hypothetical protein
MSDNVVHYGWMLPVVKVDGDGDINAIVEEIYEDTERHFALAHDASFIYEESATLYFGEIGLMNVPDITEAAGIAAISARYGLHVSVTNARMFISSYYNGADDSMASSTLKQITGKDK